MVNNHHIEEYGPLRWEYISGGSEICWIPVIIIRTLCVQITAKSKFYVFCYVKSYPTIINQFDID